MTQGDSTKRPGVVAVLTAMLMLMSATSVNPGGEGLKHE